MNNLPNAEEIYEDFYWNYKGEENTIYEAMRTFAKMHVKAALEAASESIECYPSEKDIILNSYSDENIK